MVVLSHLDYKGHDEVTTTHLLWTTNMNQIPHLLQMQKLMVVDSEKLMTSYLLDPNQKSLSWMRDVVRKVARPVAVV